MVRGKPEYSSINLCTEDIRGEKEGRLTIGRLGIMIFRLKSHVDLARDVKADWARQANPNTLLVRIPQVAFGDEYMDNLMYNCEAMESVVYGYGRKGKQNL
ncbi:hypothetical protein VNO78_28895 [Psophocarpus tetragonolobus]|uniref:Uncharacterized protein n=1 Tax=Psophocarpus tetragonolobus TaxID=3891 RepID=A0AAN9RU03_PSOTE